MASKKEIINDIYYDDNTGFQSIANTLKEAKKVDPSITYLDVKNFIQGLTHKQTHFKYKNYNSFVSPHKLYEIEIDLMDLTKLASENDGFRYAFVAIDNFTKFAHVVPIKSKTPDDIVEAMVKVFKKIGVPKQLYSDQEGSFNSKEFIRLLNKHNVKHVQVQTNAHTVERFNRTLKEKIFERLEAKDKNREQWIEEILFVVNKYNDTEQRTIKMTPNEAIKDKNHYTVLFNLRDKSKNDRVYPELKAGDKVRVMIKQDRNKRGTKGSDPRWTTEIYNVVGKSGQYYLLNNSRSKLYVRHELLKVDDE